MSECEEGEEAASDSRDQRDNFLTTPEKFLLVLAPDRVTSGELVGKSECQFDDTIAMEDVGVES
jgi:hypothetical protein